MVEEVKEVVGDGVDMKEVDIWFEDERGIGEEGCMRRVWEYKGERGGVVREEEFEWSYVFGGFNGGRGESVGVVVGYVNKEGMGLDMEEMSKGVGEGGDGVVVMEGGVWEEGSLDEENVRMVKLGG